MNPALGIALLIVLGIIAVLAGLLKSKESFEDQDNRKKRIPRAAGVIAVMGQAIADTWRPGWQNIPYGFLLAAGNHFLDCALFGGSWGNWVHYLLNAVVLVATAIFLLVFLFAPQRGIVWGRA